MDYGQKVIYCKDCFLKSVHKGHKVIHCIDENAQCACGRNDLMEKEAICKNHFDQKIDKNFNEVLKLRLENFFVTIFYAAFESIEEFISGNKLFFQKNEE